MRRDHIFPAVILLLLGIHTISLPAQSCDTQVMEPMKNYMVLIIDRSGSMQGAPLEDAKEALGKFVYRMKSNDTAALLSFESSLVLDQSFTSDPDALAFAAFKLRPGGSTRLYDAIAKGAQMLSGEAGTKVILFMTDGRDSGSTFSLSEIRQMNIGEGIFLYGIGLGDVDHAALRDLANATGGSYHVAESSGRLPDIYHQIERYHYQKQQEVFSTTGSFTISSLPSSHKVYIDGEYKGRSPLKLDGVATGTHSVEVEFDNGMWRCDAPIKAGYRNVINAREDEVPLDLWVEALPYRSAVFLDGAYIGLTSMFPSRISRRTIDYSNQMRIPSVSRGTHTLRIVAVPDFELGDSQVMEFDFQMKNQSRYVKASVFFGRAEFDDGEVITTGLGGLPGGMR